MAFEAWIFMKWKMQRWACVGSREEIDYGLEKEGVCGGLKI
jgi:hypothetical protein